MGDHIIFLVIGSRSCWVMVTKPNACFGFILVNVIIVVLPLALLIYIYIYIYMHPNIQ
jgi:hypothetical protein